MLRWIKLAVTLTVLAAAAVAPAGELRVYAAASLSDALTELGQIYEGDSGTSLVFNFAASSTLARQIKAGAPADIFFSADHAKLRDLARAGLVEEDSVRTVVSNALVVVVQRDDRSALRQPEDLVSLTRIALAETRTVPAGIYAREYLEKSGIWDAISARVVAMENVRACVAAVAAGNADAAIVYRTDARVSERVRVAYEIPIETGPSIQYPVAVLRKTSAAEAARRFVDFLGSREASAVFARHGFATIPKAI